MHFGLVAGELSGDILGAALISGLRARYPGARFSGVCGPRMQALGCQPLAHIDVLSVMGLAEVLPALPRLFALRAQLVQHYQGDRPDVFIGIDAPDFNLGLEQRIRALGVPTVHVVSPSVWAWREGRIHGIRRAVDLMLCLFPFETDFYTRHQVKAACIGHPLADSLDDQVRPTAGRSHLGLPQQPTLAVLPGSRRGEVRQLAPLFAQAIALLAQQLPGLQVLTPVARPALRAELDAARSRYAPQVPWTLLDGQSHASMQAADAVLLASGTATLETLLLGRPMVVGYRVAPFTAWLLRRMVKVKNVSLPNLLCQQAVVPECLQEACTPQALAAAVLPLLQDPQAARQQTQAFAQVRQDLRRDASTLAANAIAQLLDGRQP